MRLIIVDDMLVDIKCTKNLRIVRDDFNQIVGYYVLHLMDKNGQKARPKIRKLWRVPLARYGCLVVYPVSDIANSDTWKKFSKSFAKSAF